MCNPRRVLITLTREIHEQWMQEVARQVDLSQEVEGEVRVRQSLASLGDQVRLAIRRALSAGVDGWEAVDGGYRHEVEGGYVIYREEERSLEMVAVARGEVAESAIATRVLSHELTGTREIEGEGTYYDDEWGGRTKEVAEKEAEADAEKRLAETLRTEREAAQAAAEGEVEEELLADAQKEAAARLAEAARRERARLMAEAQERLEAVGLRGTLAFNQLLAQGIRTTIEAFAARNGGHVTQCSDDAGMLELELELPTSAPAFEARLD